MSRQVQEPKPFLMPADRAAQVHHAQDRTARDAHCGALAVRDASRLVETAAAPGSAADPARGVMTELDLGPEPTLLGVIEHHRRADMASQTLRWIIPVFLLVFVGYRLTQLGWHRIWNARPTGIGFYLLIVLQFFIQPLGDLASSIAICGAGGSAFPFSCASGFSTAPCSIIPAKYFSISGRGED